MQRWRPFTLAIVSLGSLAPVAWAADPPLCPASAPTEESSTQSAVPAAPLAGTKQDNTDKSSKSSRGEAIDITSDHATLGVDGNAVLKGNVNVREGDRQIHADEVEYNSKTNGFKTDGGIEYEDPIVHLTGKGGTYSPTAGADFKSAEFSLRQRAARGSADAMQLTPEGVINLKGVKFTTCPIAAEAWRIRADSVTLDTRSRIGDARDARVDFKGVPLIYLPWLSFPLGNERKSGFLFPTVGNNSRSGALLSVPYYWNIAPNADFTFQPIYYTKRNIDVGGDFRFLTSENHGELTWNYLPYDSVFHGERSRIKLTNVLELPGNFRFSINAENVSDNRYFEDFSAGPEGTSTAFVSQHAMLTYRDEHWRIDGEAQHFQTIDYTLAPVYRPYTYLPRIAVSSDYGWGSEQQLRYGFDSEVVNFDRSVGVTGWRADFMPSVSLNLESPAYFVRPGIAYRATQYELNNTLPGEVRSPSRTLPIASFDTGLMFERDAGSHNQRKLTLEPRVLYLYVPYRNQDALPLFDTGLPDLDPVKLFSNNRYVGADRVSDANQVSAGVTSRLLDAHDGRQFISATFGEAFYFTNPRVVMPGELPRTDRRSDFVAQLALTAFQDWNAGFGLQWNPQTSRSERASVNVQYKPAPEKVLNLAYRYERSTVASESACLLAQQTALPPGTPLPGFAVCGFEQAEISGAWPIARNWNFFFRGVYSLKDSEALERFAGFEYRACCWKVRFGARRYVSTRPIPPATTGSQDTGLWLQLELTGLASVGSASDSFLTEAIRGYNPADAALRARPY